MTNNIETLIAVAESGEKPTKKLLKACKADLEKLDKLLDAVDSLPICIDDLIGD